MIDFDPAKEAINLSKHGVSLARWVDLEVLAIVKDDRFDYGARPDIAHTEASKVYRTALSSQFAMKNIGRSVSAAHMQRK